MAPSVSRRPCARHIVPPSRWAATTISDVAPTSSTAARQRGVFIASASLLWLSEPDINAAKQVRPADGGRYELRRGVKGIHAMDVVPRDDELDGQGDGCGDAGVAYSPELLERDGAVLGYARLVSQLGMCIMRKLSYMPDLQ